MGTMLKYGSEGSKYFITSHILPKDIAVAHMDGDIQFMIWIFICSLKLVAK